MPRIRTKEAKALMGMFEQVIEFGAIHPCVSLLKTDDTDEGKYYVNEKTNTFFCFFLSGYFFRKDICEGDTND